MHGLFMRACMHACSRSKSELRPYGKPKTTHAPNYCNPFGEHLESKPSLRLLGGSHLGDDIKTLLAGKAGNSQLISKDLANGVAGELVPRQAQGDGRSKIYRLNAPSRPRA